MQDQYVVRFGEDVVGWAYLTHDFIDDGTDLINQIFVKENMRNKGIGRKLLSKMAKDADREKITLVLSFEPEEFGSDAGRLRKLYELYGFRWDDSINGMRREPYLLIYSIKIFALDVAETNSIRTYQEYLSHLTKDTVPCELCEYSPRDHLWMDLDCFGYAVNCSFIAHTYCDIPEVEKDFYVEECEGFGDSVRSVWHSDLMNKEQAVLLKNELMDKGTGDTWYRVVTEHQLISNLMKHSPSTK